MHKKHRIFIAINLPNDVKKVLAGYQKKWQDVPAKWTTPDNIHITLVFLGDVTSEELGQVCMTVKEVVKNHHSFNVTLHNVGYGPAGKIPTDGANFAEAKLRLASRPRYIWAGGERSKELSLLKKDLENAISESVRFKPDKNIFTPHITLARINEWAWRAIEPEERPEVGEAIDMIFTVESIEVMESELTRQGPRYTVVESHSLQ